MVKNPVAFSPFANGMSNILLRPVLRFLVEILNSDPGRHTCPGKQLGLLEVRMAAAMILVNFEFSLDPGLENQTRVVDQLEDAFTANPGKLEIIFESLN